MSAPRPTLLSVAIDHLLECVCGELDLATANGGRGCPCAVHQTAGPPAWRRCCAGCPDGGVGQLTGHLVDEWAYDRWPTRTTLTDPCRGGPWAADVAIILARCYPTIDNRGNPPAIEVEDAAAKQMHADVETMRRALSCCPEFRVSVSVVQIASEPRGGCVAAGARVLVDLADRELRALHRDAIDDWTHG